MARRNAASAAPAASDSSTVPADTGGNFYNRTVEPFGFKPEDLGDEFEPIDYGKVDRGDSLEPVDPPTEPDAPEPDAPEPTVAAVPEPAAAPEPEPAPTSDAPITIPKARFDEVNEQRKALARQVEELQARLNAPPPPAAPAAPEPFDFEAAEKKFLEATLDGDLDAAASLRKEINEKLINQAVHSALQHVPKTDDAVAAVRAENAVVAATAEMNALYPVFDPNSESFNEDLTKEAVFQTQAMIQMKGMSYPEAVRIAAANVAKLNGIAPSGSKPAAAPAPAKPPAAAAKIEAAANQPPATPTASAASSAEPQFDIDNMTDAEFLALPKAVRSRLRGDLG